MEKLYSFLKIHIPNVFCFVFKDQFYLKKANCGVFEFPLSIFYLKKKMNEMNAKERLTWEKK